MDTITKRENGLEVLKLAKQAMMCSCVCWLRDTKRSKSSDGRLLTTTTKKMKKKTKTSILRVGATCACARRPPNKNYVTLIPMSNKMSCNDCFVNCAPFTRDSILTNWTQSIDSTEFNCLILLSYSLSYSGCVKSHSDNL